VSKFLIGLSGDFLDQQGRVHFGDIGLDLLDAAADRVSYSFLEEIRPAITPEQIAGLDGLILCGLRADASTFAQGAERLVAIGRFGVGYDTVDVPACTANDVALFTTPPASKRGMASAALASMLMLGKRLPWKDRRLREGRWRDQSGVIGDDINGKTLGIVGLGNIGQETARLVGPFEMRVLAYDPYVDPAVARDLGVELVPSLHDLMRQADVVCIHAALTDETRGMIDGDALECMKPSAYLVNMARGPIVDQRALTEVLAARRIAAAALDVFEQEPISRDDPLLQLDNVILTPHSAGMTRDFLRAMGAIDCEGMLACARGEAPATVVNREVLERPGFRAKLARFGRP
jgi:phosphoglycerate dehydrogenase-like enzyme